MSEQVLSMEEPRRKLRELEKFMPESVNRLVYEFGRFLADYIHSSELVPQGFVMATELALYDLQTGKSGFTGESIENNLIGYPSMIYSLLRLEVPRIAEAVFPQDFANGVVEFINQVEEDARKKATNK